MRYILLAILAVLVGGIYIVLFVDSTDIKVVNRSTDFGCGASRMLTIETDKPKKHLFLVENLVKATPHLSCRMWHTYEKVANMALTSFSKRAHYQPVIHFYNAQADTLDPKRSARIIEEAANSQALAVVGFAWSTMAGIAATEAEHVKIPYISPTGVLRSISESKYSVSLGPPIYRVVEGLLELLVMLKKPKVLVVEATDQIQEREYANSFRSKYADAVSVQFQDRFPTSRVIKALEALSEVESNLAILIPGYVDVKGGVSEIARQFPHVKFIVGPQWPYDSRLIELEVDLYSVSDYFDLIENKIHAEIKEQWSANGDEIIGGFLYALHDAIVFTLEALQDPDVKTREAVREKIKNFGSFPSSKGMLSIENSELIKSIYILKFARNEGFRLIKQI